MSIVIWERISNLRKPEDTCNPRSLANTFGREPFRVKTC